MVASPSFPLQLALITGIYSTQQVLASPIVLPLKGVLSVVLHNGRIPSFDIQISPNSNLSILSAS